MAVGSQMGGRTGDDARAARQARIVGNTRLISSALPARSSPKSVSATARSVTFIMSVPASTVSPRRAAASQSAAHSAAIREMIGPNRFTLSPWKAGCTIRRCRFQKAPPLVNRPLPSTTRTASKAGVCLS